MSLTCCIKSHCTPATLAPAHTPCLFSIYLHTVRQHLVIVHFLLPKAIELHLPVCQLYCWQLCPNKWSSSMARFLHPIIVTAIWVGFPGEYLGPTTGRIACNCSMLEAWASGQELCRAIKICVGVKCSGWEEMG